MKTKLLLCLFMLAAVKSHSAEIWYIPEPGAENVEMFQQPDQWAQARSKITRYGLISLSLVPGIDGGIEKKLIQDNSFENLVRVDAFRKLQEWGIDLDIAVGSVKQEIHCDAQIHAEVHSKFFERVKQAGGKIKSFTMDWPRSSGKLDCNQTVDQTATYVANYVRKVQDAFERAHPGEKLEIGLWEGYPTFEPNELIQWLDAMIRKGYRPDYITVDIDRPHHKKLGRSDAYMRSVLKTLKRACEQRGIRFGVAFWSNQMKTTKTYRDDVLSWMRLVKSGIGAPEIIQMISWEYWVQYQNEGRVRPYNLPERDQFSHTGMLLHGAQFFGL